MENCLGLAEGYLAEDWSTPSLRDVFDFGTANAGPLDTNLSGTFVRALNALQHGRRQQMRTEQARNIADHYDLEIASSRSGLTRQSPTLLPFLTGKILRWQKPRQANINAFLINLMFNLIIT